MKKEFEYYNKWIKGEIDDKLSYEDGFIDESDNVERFSMELARKIIDGTEYDKDEVEDDLIEHIEEYLKRNYKSVSDIDKHSNYTLIYYNSIYNFKTVAELEKFFGIGA